MEPQVKDASIFIWEIMGAIFIIGAGSIMHFFFSWSGFSTVVGLFAPVNESVWEHLKMGFWPFVLFSAIEFAFIHISADSFLFAKFIGVVALGGTILIIFYVYSPIVGHPILAVDIGSFVLGTLVCQTLTLLVYFGTKPGFLAGIAGGAGLTVLAFCFLLFTYAPPKLGIFRDRTHRTYGPVRIKK